MITKHDHRWIGPLLWYGLGLATGLILCLPARASDAALAYCSLFARESARIDLMHVIPVSPSTITDDYIEGLAVKTFKECMSILPTLLPLPPEHRELKVWVEDIRALLVSRAGTKPATETPMSGDDEWRRQCAATYRTWDGETGTVIRAGNPERVRCPCGEEIDCQ